MTTEPEQRHCVKADELLDEVARRETDRETAARCDSLQVEMLGWTPQTAWKYPRKPGRWD